MALPETVIVRRKDILEHLGISKRRFYSLVELGHIRQNWMKKVRGKQAMKPVYLRDDVLKVEQMLKGEA